VILAGGSGTRLWPLTRAGAQKPFLPLDRGVSLFRRTIERIAPVVGWSRILIVTGSGMGPSVRRQAPEVGPGRILTETIGRDTTASVAIAALWLRARHRDAVMIVLPADHTVRPVAAFRATIRRAVAVADRTRRLVTIGLPALRPETQLGYIQPTGRPILPGVWRVRSFKEKPDSAQAIRMIRSGRFLWNSGIFVWRASTIVESIRHHLPRVLSALRPWEGAAARGRSVVTAKMLRRVPRTPIDRAVLERSRDVLVLRAPFEWSDVGTWDTFPALLGKDRTGNSALGRILALGARGCVSVNEGGLTVLVGLHDIAVVRSGRVVLVCSRKAAQRVRDVTRALRGRLAVYR
jgi:mannose-1-phosphate guanylyltransferase/mannose-6-phosphate isomerase